MDLHIIFEDQDIIVCYKPSGIPTQTAKVGAVDMVSLLKNYLYKTQKERREPYVAVIHRLDQPVEGILVFAKNPAAAKKLNKGLAESGFGKYYQAVLSRIPEYETGMLEDYLIKDGRTNTSRVGKPGEKDAKKAVLFYEVLAKSGEQCLVEVKLDTGRHHQIRVQMAHMGCPICGDTKYNPEESGHTVWKQIALCAYKLSVIHPKTNRKMMFEIAPKGEVFQRFQLDKPVKFS